MSENKIKAVEVARVENVPSPATTEQNQEVEQAVILNHEFNDGVITHKGFDENSLVQSYVRYAYSLGGMDFVLMLECENGQWNPFAVGDNGKAHGFCQMNTNYHKLPQEYFDNWQYQLDFCFTKWKGGTKFYGPGRIIKGKRCSEYVKDRFITN